MFQLKINLLETLQIIIRYVTHRNPMQLIKHAYHVLHYSALQDLIVHNALLGKNMIPSLKFVILQEYRQFPTYNMECLHITLQTNQSF